MARFLPFGVHLAGYILMVGAAAFTDPRLGLFVLGSALLFEGHEAMRQT